MTLRSRIALASLAFLFGSLADATLWVTWSGICHESCATFLALPSLAFMFVLPLACSVLAAWAGREAGAARKALPAASVLLAMAVALTIASFLARGHAHGG